MWIVFICSMEQERLEALWGGTETDMSEIQIDKKNGATSF
jgi:hypothetical protein